MKTKTTLFILACICTLFTFGQNDLSLTLIKKSDQPISKTEHFYMFEVENTSNQIQSIKLSSENTACAQKESQVDLMHNFLNESKNEMDNALRIEPRTSLKFYLKISRKDNTKLNSWNCTQVVIKNNDNAEVSNSVIIKTLVPDPRSFN